MQHDIQLWNNLLWASGGDLELQKCSYHVLYWKFLGNSTPSLAPGKFGPELQLDSSNRQKSHVIAQNSAYKLHKTLVYWKDPAGGSKKTIFQTTSKVSQRSKICFLQCSFSKWSMDILYSMLCSKYQLCFTKQLLFTIRIGKLSKKAMSAIIAKWGFNRNTQRTIIYDPRCYGGARFYPLHLLQGTEQILTFIQHQRAQSIPSKLLRIVVSWHQLQLGTSVSSFKDVHTPHPHAESK